MPHGLDGIWRCRWAYSPCFRSVDDEVRRIVDECYTEARRLLNANRNRLDAIVHQLLIHETLDEADVYAAAGIARPGGADAAAVHAAAFQPSGSA